MNSSSLTCVAEWSILVQRNKRGVQKYFVIIFRYDAVVCRLDPWFVFVHCRKQRERERETQSSQCMKSFRKCLPSGTNVSSNVLFSHQHWLSIDSFFSNDMSSVFSQIFSTAASFILMRFSLLFFLLETQHTIKDSLTIHSGLSGGFFPLRR